MKTIRTNPGSLEELQRSLADVQHNFERTFHGSATLSSGSVTVTDARVTVSTVIQLTKKTASTNGALRVAVSDGSFVITSSSGTDASEVFWTAYLP